MKFISSSFDFDTGISEVVVQHLGKKFIGTAKLHPDDKDKVSNYTGCQIAEMRATIKALKHERKIAKNKSDMALDFIKSVENYTKFNKEDESAKSMYRQLNRRIKEVNDITDQINELYYEIDMLPRKKSVILNSILTKKKSKQDN